MNTFKKDPAINNIAEILRPTLIDILSMRYASGILKNTYKIINIRDNKSTSKVDK